MITLLIESQDGSPATSATAQRWRDAFELEYLVVAAQADQMVKYWGSGNIPLPALKLLNPGIVVEDARPSTPLSDEQILSILP